jgi:uncharacterized protein YukE
MPQAIVDPSELRAFAARLEGEMKQIRDRKSAIASKFAELHGYWKDNKQSDFERVFNEMMARLDSFFDALEKYVGFLRTKASLADDYLHTRY